jgi:hypothetical protein
MGSCTSNAVAGLPAMQRQLWQQCSDNVGAKQWQHLRQDSGGIHSNAVAAVQHRSMVTMGCFDGRALVGAAAERVKVVVAGGGVGHLNHSHMGAFSPCPCRYISLVIVQSDVFLQDHHSLTCTNGEQALAIVCFRAPATSCAASATL